MYLLIKFVVVIVAVLFISMLADIVALKLRLKKWNLYTIIGVLSLVMTVLTVTQLQQNSVLFAAEGTILKKIHEIKENFVSDKKKEKRINDFVDGNFIFINTANDRQLVDIGQGKVAGPDNRKLLEMLSLLNEHIDNIGLVVVDVLIQHATPIDSSLFAVMNALRVKNKLALVYAKGYVSRDTGRYKEFSGALGDGGMEKNEDFYFTHRLMNEENMPSLAYLMYAKMNGLDTLRYSPGRFLIKEDFPGRTYFAFLNYISELYFTDEGHLFLKSTGDKNDEGIVLKVESKVERTGPESFYDMGYGLGSGRVELSDRLDAGDNKKKIIMIGAFTDEFIDTHPTAYGNLHGTTILLNEYYHLQQGYHHYTVGAMIRYFLTIFVGYAFIFYWMFCRLLRNQNPDPKFRAPKRAFMMHYLDILWKVVGDQFYIILLLSFAFLVDLIWNKVLNLLGILYYLIAFSEFLRLFYKNYKNPENNASAQSTASIQSPAP